MSDVLFISFILVGPDVTVFETFLLIFSFTTSILLSVAIVFTPTVSLLFDI